MPAPIYKPGEHLKAAFIDLINQASNLISVIDSIQKAILQNPELIGGPLEQARKKALDELDTLKKAALSLYMPSNKKRGRPSGSKNKTTIAATRISASGRRTRAMRARNLRAL